jgi:anti-anti-sigma factor
MSEESNGTGVSVVVGAPVGTSLVIQICGEIDIANVDYLHRVIDPVMARGDTKLVTFDLSDLAFMDSSGLALLLSVAEKVDTVKLRNASAQVQRIIEVTGLQATLRMED